MLMFTSFENSRENQRKWDWRWWWCSSMVFLNNKKPRKIMKYHFYFFCFAIKTATLHSSLCYFLWKAQSFFKSLPLKNNKMNLKIFLSKTNFGVPKEELLKTLNTFFLEKSQHGIILLGKKGKCVCVHVFHQVMLLITQF